MVVQAKFVPGLLIVTGDRNWGRWGYAVPKFPTSEEVSTEIAQRMRIIRLLREFKNRHSIAFLAVGDANGVDAMAAEEARRIGYMVQVFEADWSRYGHAAGPKRNAAMIARGLDWQAEGGNVELAAFHDDLEHSRGTKNCVKQAMDAGIRVVRG